MAGRSEDDTEEFASDPEPDPGSDASPDGDGGGVGADPAPATGDDGEAGETPRDDSEGENWRFGVDEVNEDGFVQSTIDAEKPDLEHAVFVTLGALAMVLVFVHLWTLV